MNRPKRLGIAYGVVLLAALGATHALKSGGTGAPDTPRPTHDYCSRGFAEDVTCVLVIATSSARGR